MALQSLVFVCFFSSSFSLFLAVLPSATPCYWFSLSFTVQLKVFTIFLLPTQRVLLHARSLSCSPPDIAFLCYSPESIVLILAWIDCAISYCKRRRLHHAYIYLYPFHLSLPLPSSNSFRPLCHTSAKTKRPEFSKQLRCFSVQYFSANIKPLPFILVQAHPLSMQLLYYIIECILFTNVCAIFLVQLFFCAFCASRGNKGLDLSVFSLIYWLYWLVCATPSSNEDRNPKQGTFYHIERNRVICI